MRLLAPLAAAAALLALAATPLRAQTPAESEELTPAEGQELERVLQRGRLLFEIDRAAWVASDDLMRRIADPAAAGLRGYIVEPQGSGFDVIFYGGPPEALRAYYRARVENRRVTAAEVLEQGARPPLTAPQQRLVQARGAVSRIDGAPCTEAPFNVAIIPPSAADGPVDVYALTPQTQANVYPFGGHYRATVSASGEIVAQRPFTRGCANLPMEEPNGQRPEAMLITHLLDPMPTEIHVFLSIWMGLPVYVGTGGRVWEVTGNRIRPVQAEAAAPKR